MQVCLKIGNAKSQVIAPVGIITQLREEVCAYANEQTLYAAQGIPYWDGKVRLMNLKGVFPTGLAHSVVNWLKSQGHSVVAKDYRTRPQARSYFPELNAPLTPRYYQTEALEVSKAKSRGVFKICTGGGKSLTSAMIIADKRVRTLMIVPNLSLKDQLLKDYLAWFGKEHVHTDPRADVPIIVCNFQKLMKLNPKVFERFEMLMIDEFHHCLEKNTMIRRTCKRVSTIEEIYNSFHHGRKPGVLSWDGENWVKKKVTNAFKYKSSDLLKVKIQDEDGKIKELLITRKHKMLTDQGKVEIGSMKVGDEVVLGYTTHKAGMRKRALNEGYRKHLSERATINNKKRSEKVRASQRRKIKELIAKGEYNPYGRGKYGNGGNLTPTQEKVLEIIPGSLSELVVVPQDGMLPSHYKIDVAIPAYKIAIEVDGSSHKGREEADNKKDFRLWRLGWKVVRIQENCSKDALFRLKKLMEHMMSTT